MTLRFTNQNVLDTGDNASDRRNVVVFYALFGSRGQFSCGTDSNGRRGADIDFDLFGLKNMRV